MSNIKINDVYQRIQYSAAMSQTVFTVPFPFFQNNYLFVWVNGIELNEGGAPGQYVVAGAGSPSGGTVTLVTPSINGDIVTIEGVMPIDRTSIYSATISNLTGSDLNGDFNREVVMMKQIQTTQALLQLQYAPWELVSQDVSVTRDRYLPILAPQQVFRMNEDGTAFEGYTLDTTPPSTSAPFVIFTEDPTLDTAQDLGQLTSGILKQTVVAGVATLAIAIPGTDYLLPTMPLGSMAYQDSTNVNITGGVANLTAGQVSTSPTLANDLVNKAYADSIAAGFIFKASCYATTTTNLSATYANGASGVGATLTATGNGVLSMDGVSPPALSRVCITDQSTTFQNGIYVVTQTGSVSLPFILTRATDFDTSAEILPGSITFIQEGTLYGDTSFVETEIVPTVGTSPILFIQFSQTYPLSMGNGGTGANIAPVVNSLVVSGASAMALIAPANNSVLVYSAGGVPSASTTLPAGLTIPTPRIAQINDTNGNGMLQLSAVASAVNFASINNSATGNPVGIGAVGTDTNVQFNIASKGIAQVISLGALGGISPVAFYNGTAYQHGTNFIFSNTPALRNATFQDSDGTVSWLTDRDWVRLGTANASSSAAIAFTGLTGYTSYMLVWDSIFAATNGAVLTMQGSINNGSTWLSAAPAYYQQSMFAIGAALTAGSDITTLTSAVISSSNSNIGTNVNCGYMVLENLALTTGSRPGYTGQTVHINTTPTVMGMSYWGQIRDPGSPVNAIRILMTAGNIVSGTVQIYGMK